MSQTIDVHVYDIQELKAEAIRRWPQRGMQLQPNVLLDEVMPVAGVVRNGLFIVVGADEWAENSPLKSLMEFLERYYESPDAFDVFNHAQVDWRYTSQSVADYCSRIGMTVDELPQHPSMIRESAKKAAAQQKEATAKIEEESATVKATANKSTPKKTTPKTKK